MSTFHYAIFVIPTEHADAMCRVFEATLPQDMTWVFSMMFSPDNGATVTHRGAGTAISLAEHALYASFATALPTPPGGWPYRGVTEQQAQAAAQALFLNVTTETDVDLGDMAATNTAAVCSALGVERWEEPI